MPNSATITAKTGPGLQVTAGPITNITSITFDMTKKVMNVTRSNPISNGEYELTGNNTITLTAVAGSYTLTIT